MDKGGIDMNENEEMIGVSNKTLYQAYHKAVRLTLEGRDVGFGSSFGEKKLHVWTN